jgi:hypothetical protein
MADEIAEGAALAAQHAGAQAGLVAKSIDFDSVHSGGTVMPFLMSRWRCPITCRSTVSTSALHLAAIARSISALDEAAVLHDVELKPERLVDIAATSSIEQIDIVLSVYGMPAACAARQA